MEVCVYPMNAEVIGVTVSTTTLEDIMLLTMLLLTILLLLLYALSGCNINPCLNGGLCIPDERGGYMCNCVNDYTGRHYVVDNVVVNYFVVIVVYSEWVQ